MAKQTRYSVLTNHDHLEIESKIYVILPPIFYTRRGWKHQNNKRLCKQIQWLPDKTRRPASNNSLSMSWWVHQAMINWGKQHTISTQKTRCHMRSIRCFQDRGKHFPLAALTWDDNTCENPRWWQSFYLVNLVAKCQHPKPNTTRAATHPTSQVLLAAHSQHYDVQVLQKGHQGRSLELNRLIWSEAFPKRALRLNL